MAGSSVSLADNTSFRIGGPAEHFLEPRTFGELAELVGRCHAHGVPIRVLGSGSNLLVSDDGVAGAVIRLTRMKDISRDGTRVRCEAGASLPLVVRKAEQWGLSGFEPLAGIPGTIGGAVAMNAGGKFGSIASVLRSVTTLDPFGFVHERAAQNLALDYRTSNLRGEVVVRAAFELVEKDPVEIIEARLAVLEDKTRTQPLSACSAGCIFRNPKGRHAGQLIDLAGLKGRRVGRAVVSPMHANFIINEGGATAKDVTALIGMVREGVHKAFGIDLKLEIELWN